MTYTVSQLIVNPVQRPIRRVYIKRRLQATGVYETNWLRIDNINGINRVLNYGTVNFKIDAAKILPNTYDIDDLSLKFTNEDGRYNSGTDYRSIWSGYRDHKDTKIKVVCAMFDPDYTEVGTVTAFEGVIQSVDSKGDNTATIKATSYAKKLNDFPFYELSITGNKTVTQILTAIFAVAKVQIYFPAISTTISPVNNVTIDTSSGDEVYKGTYWDVIKFLAGKSNSTLLVVNDTFYFGTRENVSTTPEFTFAGLGNTQADRIMTIYGKPSYDQSGADKLYTTIIDSSSNLVGDNSGLDPLLIAEGKTLTVDLADIGLNADKQAILDSYIARFGVRRPSVNITVPFMMLTLFPLDIIAIDSPGARTELNAIVWDSSSWDDGSVWDGDGGSAVISKNDRFIIESISYDIDKWESKIFARKQV